MSGHPPPLHDPQSMMGTRANSVSSPRWQPILAITILIAATIAVYANSFHGVFLFDDEAHILNNESIRALWPPARFLPTRRPILDFTLALNYAIHDFDVWGYHLINLVVHILAGLTLFGLVRRCLQLPRSGPFSPNHAVWLTGAVALLWLIHPLNTQSVTYIVQRGEALMGLFYLLALYCVIRCATSSRSWQWAVVAIISCALGMGSKAVMVTAPIAAFFFDRCLLTGSFRETLRRRWWLHLGLASTWCVLWSLGIVAGIFKTAPNPEAHVGFAHTAVTPIEYLQTQPGVLLHYLKLSLWPVGQCLDYLWPVARSSAAILVPSALFLTLLALTIWALIRRPPIGFVAAMFFLVLLPTSSLIPIKDLAFEHRMYLPLASVILLVVIGVNHVAAFFLKKGQWLTSPSSQRRDSPSSHQLTSPGSSPPISNLKSEIPHARDTSPRSDPIPNRASALHRTVATACFLGVFVAAVPLALGTIRRNRAYHSAEAMWRDVAAKAPHNYRAYLGIGAELQKKGELTGAIEMYRRALSIKREYSDGWFDLGTALEASGDLDNAIAAYREAIRLTPKRVAAYEAAGKLLARGQRFSDAADLYDAAISKVPGNASLLINRANALFDAGRFQDAASAYDDVLKIEPRNADAHVNLGASLRNLGDVPGAITHYETAIGIDPANAHAHFNLGGAWLQLGRVNDAKQAFTRALTIDPNHNASHEALEMLNQRSP